MVQNKSKGKFYLSAILGKASAEVSFIEVLSEAIGGFMLAGFAHFKGWIDQDGVCEMLLDYVGFAILIPLIAFVLRVFFAAPAELVRESAENRTKCEINPKSIYPAIIAILLAICSFLSVCLIFSLKFDFSKSDGKSNLSHVAVKEPPKPLPDKIIPKPEPPPTISTQSLPAAVTEAQFETNDDSGDSDDPVAAIRRTLAKAKAEQAAADEKSRQEIQASFQSNWNYSLPHYRYALQTLYDVLRDVSAKNNDGVAKTEGYFQCLPSTINSGISETKLAEIRFQKQTNVSFTVSIMNENDAKTLKFSADCGMFRIYHWMGQWGAGLNIPASSFDDHGFFKDGNDRERIREGLRSLVAEQMDFLSHTNQ